MTHNLEVGAQAERVQATPTLTNHASYASGDFVGTSVTPITFSNVVPEGAGSGWISGAVLIDYALQSVACELWLFDTAITPSSDSDAWSLSDADAATCVAIIPFSTYYASALNSVSMGDGLPKKFKCAAASNDLYGAIVTRGAPTYASGDLTIRLYIDQD